MKWWTFGYGSIPINTIFRGMTIHLPAILMWTTGVPGFWHTAISLVILRFDKSGRHVLCEVLLASTKKDFPWTQVHSFLARKQTRWCPPNVLNWFINPSNYRYITNKNQSEIGVMFTNWTLSWGHHLELNSSQSNTPMVKCDFGMPIIITSASQPAKQVSLVLVYKLPFSPKSKIW